MNENRHKKAVIALIKPRQHEPHQKAVHALHDISVQKSEQQRRDQRGRKRAPETAPAFPVQNATENTLFDDR